MAVYVVAYDLTREGSDAYKDLYAALERLDCVRVQESLWLVDTVMPSANTLKAWLIQYGKLDGNDRLWVSQLTTDHAGENAMPGTKAFVSKHRSSLPTCPGDPKA